MSQSSNPSSQWSVPTAFDGYRVLMTLSDGPRSQVCLGHDTVLDRPVVIRFLNLPEGDSLARQTFFAEARATARIAHPNVMTIYRVGESNGRPYVISEYVQGQILSTVTKPMNPRATRDCALGIARGLTGLVEPGVLANGEAEAESVDLEHHAAYVSHYHGRSVAVVGLDDSGLPLASRTIGSLSSPKRSTIFRQDAPT